jgi:hypothetical protein
MTCSKASETMELGRERKSAVDKEHIFQKIGAPILAEKKSHQIFLMLSF